MEHHEWARYELAHVGRDVHRKCKDYRKEGGSCTPECDAAQDAAIEIDQEEEEEEGKA